MPATETSVPTLCHTLQRTANKKNKDTQSKKDSSGAANTTLPDSLSEAHYSPWSSFPRLEAPKPARYLSIGTRYCNGFVHSTTMTRTSAAWGPSCLWSLPSSWPV